MIIMRIAYGIDFGTTNSACIGLTEANHRIPFGDEYDGAPFPSFVAIDKVSGKVHTGRECWSKRQEFAQTCEIITSVKRYLGSDRSWKIAGKEWTPSDIACEILKAMKKNVSNSGAGELKCATISVPVGFSFEKRADLRKAAEKAGIDISSFVSESTAAFFKFYENYKHMKNIGIIDWGGGTLDVSILENKNGTIRELSTAGAPIGGDIIDHKLAEWAHREYSIQKNLNLSFDQMPAHDRDSLIYACEQAKKRLYVKDAVEIALLKYGPSGTLRRTIDATTFASLIDHEVSQTISCFEGALSKSLLGIEELDCIIMVGGSVQLRPFIDKVEAKWDVLKVWPEESEWSVADGSAQLEITSGKNVVEKALGILLADSSFYPLIKWGEIADGFCRQFVFSMVEDSTTANLIFIDEDKNLIGTIDLPITGFFQEKIELEVLINENLICCISARSRNRSHQYCNQLQYSGLKFNYVLPDSNKGMEI